ncbi:unnamed protein product [Cyclocybe aegerita]|uniref:Cytochrome P450 n=1 Tax=Cyclocybe aegerita TaxID=1973307 RepID=A0A8S0WSU3_CYCAE|nr:unnamed protein product [Cyclocybe aegerita]
MPSPEPKWRQKYWTSDCLQNTCRQHGLNPSGVSKRTFCADAAELSVGHILTALSVVFVISRIMAYRRKLQAVSNVPGFRVPFYPLGVPGFLLPSTWWNPAIHWTWNWRHTVYKQYGNDTISVAPFVIGPASFYSANLDVARQVAGGEHKTSFVKPKKATSVPTYSISLDARLTLIRLWGMNLVTADGNTWRNHRRIMGPAFNPKLYELVWKQTLNTYYVLTFKFALLIIAKCGFGLSFNWDQPPRAGDGTMTVQAALRTVIDNHLLMNFLPKWIQNLPFKKLNETREANDQLMAFMQDQVEQRKADIRSKVLGKETAADAFTMLVEANEDEATKHKLDDVELIGNVFNLLFAGHVSTKVSKKTFTSRSSVLGHDRDPTLEEYNKLDKVLYAFYEALRMVPSGFLMIREAFEDTALHVPNPVGQEGSTTLAVPKGTQVIVDMIGVQYNPRYFDEPEKYKPSRWYGVSNESEAFSAFSIGPRACLGRKFAVTEAVAFLSVLLRDYKVKPIYLPGETKEQWQERVLVANIVLTLGVSNVPIQLIRRTRA